jgi:hypothetical protein
MTLVDPVEGGEVVPIGSHVVGAVVRFDNLTEVIEPREDPNTFKLIDGAGKQYSVYDYTDACDDTESGGDWNSYKSMAPGTNFTGCVLFQVPDGATPERLVLPVRTPSGTNGVATWLL